MAVEDWIDPWAYEEDYEDWLEGLREERERQAEEDMSRLVKQTKRLEHLNVFD